MTTIAALILSLTLDGGDPFVVDVSAAITYAVDVSRNDLASYTDDIGLFRRNMTGVVGVDSLGVNRYLYRTSKEVPLKGKMEVDFVIEKSESSDTVTVYRTPGERDPNWMECRVALRAEGDRRTSISIALRLRLEREHGYQVHWLAPIVGAGFLRDRMEEDLNGMLREFAENSARELQDRFPWSPEPVR
jgi:hypothetical protein